MRCAASGTHNPRKLPERTETRHTEPHSTIIAHTMPNSRPNRAVIFCASVNLHICERATAARAKTQKLHLVQLSDNYIQIYYAKGRICNFHENFINSGIAKTRRKAVLWSRKNSLKTLCETSQYGGYIFIPEIYI